MSMHCLANLLPLEMQAYVEQIRKINPTAHASNFIFSFNLFFKRLEIFNIIQSFLEIAANVIR